MKRIDSSILAIEEVALDYYQLTFAWDATAGRPQPGSFLTLRASQSMDPVLRRPFAFSGFDAEKQQASIIFQQRGRGTRWMAGLKPGAALDILGPLGKGFNLPGRGVRPMLIAGGIGLGPMLYLMDSLQSAATEGSCEAPLLVLGFRNAASAPRISLPEHCVLCTDDGSAGFHGSVVDWLEQHNDLLPPYYYACGPVGMMRGIDRFAQTRQAGWQAATEQWMACGVGACMGCVLPLKDGSYRRCCVEGPVFDGQLIAWSQL